METTPTRSLKEILPRKENKSEHTKAYRNKKLLKSNKEANKIELKEINKRTIKAIREDLRQYKLEKTRQTIEENRSLKVLKEIWLRAKLK